MINGTVTSDLEAIIRVVVRGPMRHEQEFEAVVDTGFNGWLSLPGNSINQLGLPWLTRGRVILADGTEQECDVYTATVIWDGKPCRVPVDAAETDPLVGMSLLNGFDLHMQVRDGGSVTIELS